ncbi:hypothetical protein [Mycolicibacterium sp. SCSIO 43805]|uniref:hypothetical protein n=1 Tax=Mycolicibacterium sp. SCSIO 43805 TaxID=3378074 RepID=UPI003AB7E6DA
MTNPADTSLTPDAGTIIRSMLDAGPVTDTTPAIVSDAAAIRNRLKTDIAAVEAKREYTFEAKSRMVNDLRAKAQQQLDGLRETRDSDTDKRRTQLRAKLLNRNPYFDPANSHTQTLLWRDADERVGRINDETEAETMMRQALRNHDTPLTKTLLRAAYDQRWASVVNAYTEANPRDYEPAEELWDLSTPKDQSIKALMADAMQFTL